MQGSLHIGLRHVKASIPGLVGEFPKFWSSVGPKSNHGPAHAVHLTSVETNSAGGCKGLPQATWSMSTVQRPGGHRVTQGT